MATATAKTIRTPVITTTYAEAQVVTLELTEREAETLRIILWRVGGCPQTTRRGCARDIYDALSKAFERPLPTGILLEGFLQFHPG